MGNGRDWCCWRRNCWRVNSHNVHTQQQWSDQHPVLNLPSLTYRIVTYHNKLTVTIISRAFWAQVWQSVSASLTRRTVIQIYLRICWYYIVNKTTRFKTKAKTEHHITGECVHDSHVSMTSRDAWRVSRWLSLVVVLCAVGYTHAH